MLVTATEGVLARAEGRTLFRKFSNANSSGRTGRGDTTFAGYLAWRREHGVEESLRYAAALTSLKMETQGPFRGTAEQVLERLRRGAS